MKNVINQPTIKHNVLVNKPAKADKQAEQLFL